MKILGSSKMAIGKKVTLIDEVVNILKIKQGERLAYLESDGGEIIIKKLSDVELKYTR